MTEKIKDRMNNFLVTFSVSLLVLIAGGVGWLIAQNVYKDADQDRQITTTDGNVEKCARVIVKDKDTSPDDKRELEPIYFNTHSGKSIAIE